MVGVGGCGGVEVRGQIGGVHSLLSLPCGFQGWDWGGQARGAP